MCAASFVKSKASAGVGSDGAVTAAHYMCAGEVPHGRAHQLCQAIGARLCTPEELANDVAKNTGCDLDAMLVWTLVSHTYLHTARSAVQASS